MPWVIVAFTINNNNNNKNNNYPFCQRTTNVHSKLNLSGVFNLCTDGHFPWKYETVQMNYLNSITQKFSMTLWQSELCSLGVKQSDSKAPDPLSHTHTARLRACLLDDAGLGSICHTSVALPRPCLSVCVSLCHLWGLDGTKSGWAVRVDGLQRSTGWPFTLHPPQSTQEARSAHLCPSAVNLKHTVDNGRPVASTLEVVLPSC